MRRPEKSPVSSRSSESEDSSSSSSESEESGEFSSDPERGLSGQTTGCFEKVFYWM